MPDEIINTGVKLGRRPTDYFGSTLPYIIRKPTGDWTLNAPPGERQWNWKADSMACVSFSAINCLETQEHHLTGKQPNYSDRWTAKMSDTTNDGNWLWKVAETIKSLGLVLEADYPSPSEPWTFDEYHAAIPEPLYGQLVTKGQNWRLKWHLGYEEVPVNAQSFEYHLKHAPLQVVIPGHAMVSIYCKADLIRFFDTYEPFIRDSQLANVIYAYKLVLTPRLMNKAKVVKSKKDATVYVCYPMSQWELLKERASLEGIEIPDPIPNTDIL